MITRYRQIILHVGMHKTGTTSIQNNTHRMREALLEHDIYYPSFLYNDILKVNHSGPITALVSESPDRYGEQWRTDMGSDIDSIQRQYQSYFSEILESPKAQTLVLSGETTSAFDIEDLQKIRDALEAHTDKLRVLVYIRDPSNSVASTLQQRIRGGGDLSRSRHIRNLAGVVRRRYTRLIEVFPDSLEVINFHEEVASEAGLVGSFLIRCGFPTELVNDMKFSSANPRISMEAFKVMSAINKRYPAFPITSNTSSTPEAASPRETRARQYNDLRSLSYLPGQSFRLESLEDQKMQEAIQEETQWLEDNLKIAFPVQRESAAGPLWDESVLLCLEDAIRDLGNREHQLAAADFLMSESQELLESQPYASAILAFTARKIHATKHDPLTSIVKRLGADYFKNGALQAESYSFELALELMKIAEHLRPDGGTIKQSIAKYLKKLDK
ncbi:MAG: hypothetical protein ACJASY_000137 [Halioglobus sp.]|jgi:hypothetical protein